MKYELWYSPSETAAVLLHESAASSLSFKASDAFVIWSVDTATYEEAVQKRDEYLDSLKSDFVISPDNSTTRFTMAVYVDDNGQERSIAAPGWVGMVQPLIDARVGISSIRGQIYVERPGRNASFDTAEFSRQASALGVKEITVVDLRSVDGSERMSQEFRGRIEDQERLWYMLQQRLGAELSNWRVVETVIFRPRN